jgi:SAM-dependent methyltransferase
MSQSLGVRYRRLRPLAAALAPVKGPLLALLRQLNAVVRRVGAVTHRLQYLVEWGVPPVPEWYDHRLDIYSEWPRSGNALSLERGVFGNLAMQPGARLLDLCCGDGFNAVNFYAHRASSVVAVDFDPEAIDYARRCSNKSNVEFRVCDIRDGLPAGPFNQATWDAAIEHFTDDEIRRVLRNVHDVLADGGVLSGYTIIERGGGEKYLPQHEREFTSKSDLLGFLLEAFVHATVFETEYPERRNLYFFASDSRPAIPFEPGNPRFLTGVGAASGDDLGGQADAAGAPGSQEGRRSS